MEESGYGKSTRGRSKQQAGHPYSRPSNSAKNQTASQAGPSTQQVVPTIQPAKKASLLGSVLTAASSPFKTAATLITFVSINNSSTSQSTKLIFGDILPIAAFHLCQYYSPATKLVASVCPCRYPDSIIFHLLDGSLRPQVLGSEQASTACMITHRPAS